MVIRNNIRMDRTKVEVCRLSELDQKDVEDVEFWRQQPIEKRLEAIEMLRQVCYGYDPLADRLPRILEIIKPE